MTIIIVKYALVGEQIGAQYIKARYRSGVHHNKNEVLKICYNYVFCLVDVDCRRYIFSDTPSQLF
jgi:hypothetical protein